MELEDIRRQHRLLAGDDLLTGIKVEPDAVRRQCEKEARSRLLRLRALYLATAGAPSALERLMLESLRRNLIFLRHLLGVQGHAAGIGHRDALQRGQEVRGPFPLMSRVPANREGRTRLGPRALRLDFREYLGEVERIVDALDILHA